MDDSERSYGYSEDIYHGRRGAGGDYGTFDYDRPGGSYDSPRFYPERGRRERSYEYGPEGGMGGGMDRDLSPEEAAIHIEDRGLGTGRGRERRAERGGGSYDYDRRAYGDVESFTWGIPGPHTGRGPKGYRRSDDRIHEEVCDRLEACGDVDAREVEVQVKEGEVTLAGTVPDRRMKRLAERVADSVRGVVDVHNRLRLARDEAGR